MPLDSKRKLEHIVRIIGKQQALSRVGSHPQYLEVGGYRDT